MSEPKVARDAEERGKGICRTCLAPIWNEGGTIGRRKRETGWSDRIERGGDSLVCFKAVEYRHVPLTGREAEIYDFALARGAGMDGEAFDRLIDARVRAGVVAEEPEVPARSCDCPCHHIPGYFHIAACCPWVPVKQEGADQ